jgi:hypothetical protein
LCEDKVRTSIHVLGSPQPCTERLKSIGLRVGNSWPCKVCSRNSRLAFQSVSLNPMPGIPTYGADGLRRRNHSLETVLYMESRKAAVLQRTRTGEVLRAQLCGASSVSSRTRHKAGTHYSYFNARHGWALTRLPRIPVVGAQGLTNNELAAEVDCERRLAFRAVQVSVRK